MARKTNETTEEWAYRAAQRADAQHESNAYRTVSAAISEAGRAAHAAKQDGYEHAAAAAKSAHDYALTVLQAIVAR